MMNPNKMRAESNSTTMIGMPTRRQVIAGAALAWGGLTLGATEAWSAAAEEISHTAESIHQEPVFKADRKRVYEALIDAKLFNSAANQTGISIEKAPTQIGREAGGAFSLFGGIILGRHIELVPVKRIVQAWRVASWDTGVYSIAKFELAEQAAETKVIFDHTGFPQGYAEHLVAGWKAHYWGPLEKFLA